MTEKAFDGKGIQRNLNFAAKQKGKNLPQKYLGDVKHAPPAPPTALKVPGVDCDKQGNIPRGSNLDLEAQNLLKLGKQ